MCVHQPLPTVFRIRRRAFGGFTLLELLVSISIFSVIGLGAYQMLQTVVQSHDRVRQSTEAFTRVNLALSIMQRDFNQFTPRPARDGYGEFLAPIIFEGDDFAVEFTRGGWANPAGRLRSRLQRVAYSIDYDEETLTRHFWTVLDRAEDSEPFSEVILSGISDFRVTGFSGDDAGIGDDLDFDLDEVGEAAPLAVEVVITTEGLGDIERLFELVHPFKDSGGEDAQGQNEDGTGDFEDSSQDSSEDNNTQDSTNLDEEGG